MSRIAGLKQRASYNPVRTFLIVLVLHSGLVVAALYAAFGSDFPGAAAIPYAWTPMVSAGVTVWLCGESVRGWLGQLRNLRAGLHWYIIGIGIMMLGTDFESVVTALLGGDVAAPAAPLFTYVLLFGITLFLAGALEELGWRGFLQPHLQQRFSALHASIGIGIVWGLWHIPLILAGAGNFPVFWEYMLVAVAGSIVLGWLYNNTDGALPVVMVAHASHNMAPIGDPAGNVPAVFNILSGDAMFYILCASLITLYAGSQTLTRDGTLPHIPSQLNKHLSQRETRAD